MKSFTEWAWALALVSLWLASFPARAALAPGDAAPDFQVEAARAGQAFHFSLADALRKGPVVLYFYPKSFTSGCTVEAHNFAESSAKFEALGATLLGMSGDDIATQKDFSVRECRDKFAVGADEGGKVMRQYDAKMPLLPVADRISYVISPEGRVIYAYSSMSPDHHVENALQAVQAWREKHPGT
jgi:peroxiredoxin